jgi:5-(carboxyamino)imidazole ribonucleotide synthase
VIVARNENGEEKAYPVVEMTFHPEANLVDMLLAPARIDDDTATQAIELALRTARAFDVCGLLAVELFLNHDGSIWVNEVAPRPHNSGHHTIESCVTSQFEQHLRAVLNLPLGDTRLTQPAVMLNVLGAEDQEGPAAYEGLAEAMALPGVHLHLYGKSITKPFRKMGHITVTANTLEQAIEIAAKVRVRAVAA